MEPSAASAPAATSIDAAPEFSPGTRVVQIGPPQTGIGTLQRAMHHSRDALAAQGVRYASEGEQAYRPALGLIGAPRPGLPHPEESWWADFADEVNAAGDVTTVVSSELFAHAGPAHIERLAGDLGPSRLQVVRLVRRYDVLLPTQWQHSLIGGRRQRLEGWASGVLDQPEHHFWDVHAADTLTRRWAEAVGPDRVTCLFIDEDDAGWPARVTEHMLGLDAGTLQAEESAPLRHLLAGEAEMVRQLAGTFHRMQWSDHTHAVYLRAGVGRSLRSGPADPGDRPIQLAPATAKALVARTEHDLDVMDSLGVNLVGDRSWLAPAPTPRSGGRPLAVSVGTVAAAVSGVVQRARTEGGFALGGRWPAEFLGAGAGVGTLPHGGDAIVEAIAAALEDEGYSADIIERYAHTGAAAGLRTLSAAPESFMNQAGPKGAPAEGMVASQTAAAAVAGAVAAADGRLYA